MVDTSNGSYLSKECKGLLRSKWARRFFFIDRNTKALVQFNNEKKATKDRKEKLKLCDLHGVDRVKNVITVVGKNGDVIVLKADKNEIAESWFTVLDKDFAEARRARDEQLQREAADKAKAEAEAAANAKMGEMNDVYRKSQADKDAAHAATLAEQQKKFEEERKAREATEAALAEQQRALEEEAARVAQAKAEEEEKARLAAEKEISEARMKKQADAKVVAQAKAKAEAAKAKAKAEAEARAAKQAAEKARLEQEALAKLDRNARFSGPNSIYHEAPTTWVDYPIISKNEEIRLRRSINSKAAANDYVAQQRKGRAGSNAP